MKFLLLFKKSSFYRPTYPVFIFSQISLKFMFWKYMSEQKNTDCLNFTIGIVVFLYDIFV